MELLYLFKEGCLDIFGKGFDLAKLLDAITEQEVQRNQLFFGSLKNQIKFLKLIFKLINEQKIACIDDELINQLIQMEKQSYLEAEQAPKVLGDSKEEDLKLQTYLLLFKQKNQLPKLNELENNFQLQNISKLLKCFKIQNLTYTQKAAWLSIDHFFKNKLCKISMKFETGAGKTTLGILFLLYWCISNKVKSFYVTNSTDLCFKDYSRLAPIAQQQELKVSYIDLLEDIDKVAINSDIFFLQTPVYYQLTRRKEWREIISKSFLLLDEFDETLFAKEVTKDKIVSFTLSQWLVAVTGSCLEQIHSTILQLSLSIVFLEFPSTQALDGKENQCKEQKIFSTRKQQFSQIVSICSQLTTKTPVLLILEKEGHKVFYEQAKSLCIKDLNLMRPEQIETFLNGGFLQKQQQCKGNGCYYICLLNETQGRGMDVPTNTEIEDNGGIATIIAKTESYQELDQFKGRTKRLCNKGLYFIVLWKKGVKETCQEFLNFHLGSAQKTDFIRLSNLLNELTISKNQDESQKMLGAHNIEDSEIFEQLNRVDDSGESFDSLRLSKKFSKLLEKQSRPIKKRLGKKDNKKNIYVKKQQQQRKNVQSDALLKDQCKKCKDQCTGDYCDWQKKEPNQDNMNQDEKRSSNIRVDIFGALSNGSLLQKWHIATKVNGLMKKAINQRQEVEVELSMNKKEEEPKVRVNIIEQETQRKLIDEGYFKNYSGPSIHKEMLDDKIRVEMYQQAIKLTCKSRFRLWKWNFKCICCQKRS